MVHFDLQKYNLDSTEKLAHMGSVYHLMDFNGLCGLVIVDLDVTEIFEHGLSLYRNAF